MHESAMQAARDFRDKYLKPGWRILDVGSRNVSPHRPDLSLKAVFGGWDYVGMDLIDGENVDVVCSDGHRFPFNNSEFDVVASANALEHDPAFWLTFKEMCRVSKRLVYLSLPGQGQYHPEPQDYWRFMDDAPKALADWADVELLESYMMERTTWRDSISVFEVKR